MEKNTNEKLIKQYKYGEIFKSHLKKDEMWVEIEKVSPGIKENVLNVLNNKGAVFCVKKDNVIKALYFFDLEKKSIFKTYKYDKIVCTDDVLPNINLFDEVINDLCETALENLLVMGFKTKNKVLNVNCFTGFWCLLIWLSLFIINGFDTMNAINIVILVFYAALALFYFTKMTLVIIYRIKFKDDIKKSQEELKNNSVNKDVVAKEEKVEVQELKVETKVQEDKKVGTAKSVSKKPTTSVKKGATSKNTATTSKSKSTATTKKVASKSKKIESK